MKEIKLIAQPKDTVFAIDDDGYIFKSEVIGITIYKDGSVGYEVINDYTSFKVGIVGNTIDELLENLKNEYLQRTQSS